MVRIGQLLKLLLAAGLIFTVSAEENGFHVKNGRILEYNGSDFVARGINYPYAWYINDWNTSVSAIAATGANCVRIVCSNGLRWTKTGSSELQQIIQKCKDNKLIAVLEVHDCTGYPDQTGSVQLTTAVSYWKEMKNALTGQEKYVWINIANEPFGNSAANVDWVDQHKSAVTELRAAGFQHLLVIDAANWGQDHTLTTHGSSGQVLDADTLHRTVMSVHMYDVYKNDTIVNNYLRQFAVTKKWPLIVGEFAADHGSNKPVDEQAILDRTKEYGLGFLGWSWSGNSSGLESLDITNRFNAGSLTSWGTTLINGTNGIKTTAKTACVYGGAFVEPPVATAAAEASRGREFLRIVNRGRMLEVVLPPQRTADGRIEVIDIAGRTVRSVAVTFPAAGAHGSRSIDLREVPCGIYLMRFTAKQSAPLTDVLAVK